MVDLMYCLINVLFINIPLLYYINISSSITFCLSSGDLHLSFGMYVSSKLFSECNFLDELLILSTVLIPIKSPVASAVFWIALFQAVLLHLL